MKYWLIIAVAVSAIVFYANRPNKMVIIAQDAVRARLKDPQSAEFVNVEPCPANPAMMQGQFNSKNSFGGMVGFTQFYTFSGRALFPSDVQDIELENKLFTYGHHLHLACQNGANPDPDGFSTAVFSGSSAALIDVN